MVEEYLKIDIALNGFCNSILFSSISSFVGVAVIHPRRSLCHEKGFRYCYFSELISDNSYLFPTLSDTPADETQWSTCSMIDRTRPHTQMKVADFHLSCAIYLPKCRYSFGQFRVAPPTGSPGEAYQDSSVGSKQVDACCLDGIFEGDSETSVQDGGLDRENGD